MKAVQQSESRTGMVKVFGKLKFFSLIVDYNDLLIWCAVSMHLRISSWVL